MTKRQPIRKECACFMGNDIGAYNTCLHMCKYCYANYDECPIRIEKYSDGVIFLT
nr:DUF1848 family protein [Eubacterium ventriosum]